MKRISLFLLVSMAVALLSGCGDPAPSTTLAPDKPPMDLSKMTPEQQKALEKADHSPDQLKQ